MELSIVIPCFNEESRIKKSFEQIVLYIKNNNYDTELVFINDGSRDQTLSILNSLVKNISNNKLIKAKIITYKMNKGKGFAIKQGLMHSTKELILICDADLSTPIEELERLKKYIKNYDLVIGSRKQGDSVVILPQPPMREFLGKSFSYMSKVILAVNINDFTCGFKLFKRKSAKIIADKMTINRWGYDSEILKIATVLGLKIKEIGIFWKNDKGTKVKLSYDILFSFIDLMRIYINNKFNRYG